MFPTNASANAKLAQLHLFQLSSTRYIFTGPYYYLLRTKYWLFRERGKWHGIHVLLIYVAHIFYFKYLLSFQTTHFKFFFSSKVAI